MKTNHLKTTINRKFIYKQKNLSYHSKCILSKIISDLIVTHTPLDFFYLEENFFSIWPSNVITTALDEFAENDIMFIDFNDEEDEDLEPGELLFNPDFLEKACPFIENCPCCNPAPINFNVNYN